MRPEFTAQARKEIKKICKERVLSNLGRCVGIKFLFSLPFVLLVILMYAAMFSRVIAMVLSGYQDEYMLVMALASGMNTVWVTVFLMLVISGPLSFGLMRFYVRLQRGEEAGVGTLLEPFTSLRSIWAGIKMEFCLAFRSFLWMIGPVAIYMVLTVAVTVNASIGGDPNAVNVPMTILYILFLLAMIPVELKVMTYQAGWAALCDDETRSVWDATRESTTVFKGQLGKLFVFVLSFLGWNVLAVAVTYLCAALGVVGLIVVQGGLGIAILVLCIIAALCLLILFSAFVDTYQMSSFFGMYEYLRMPPVWPQDTPPADTLPGQDGDGGATL